MIEFDNQMEHCNMLKKYKGGYCGLVLRVVDGDTLDIKLELERPTDYGFGITSGGRFIQKRTRLAGCDTPEVYGVKKGSDEWLAGKEASDFTVSLCPPGTRVWCVTHKESGKYGRYIANVRYRKDGASEFTSLNKELIDAGYGDGSEWTFN